MVLIGANKGLIGTWLFEILQIKGKCPVVTIPQAVGSPYKEGNNLNYISHTDVYIGGFIKPLLHKRSLSAGN